MVQARKEKERKNRKGGGKKRKSQRIAWDKELRSSEPCNLKVVFRLGFFWRKETLCDLLAKLGAKQRGLY